MTTELAEVWKLLSRGFGNVSPGFFRDKFVGSEDERKHDDQLVSGLPYDVSEHHLQHNPQTVSARP